MAASVVSILSGIMAASAGLAGEKVSKSGSIPGLDLAAIIPALLGKSTGAAGIMGTLASAAAKSGLINNANIAELAGSLFSVAKTQAVKKTAASGKIDVAGLAAAIIGSSGTSANLESIASMAMTLGKSAKDTKGLTKIASELGKTLSSSGGISFGGGATALKGLDKVLGSDVKCDLFKAVLKGLG